jgi:hypothetical protein
MTVQQVFQRNRQGQALSRPGKMDFATEITRLEQTLREDLQKNPE